MYLRTVGGKRLKINGCHEQMAPKLLIFRCIFNIQVCGMGKTVETLATKDTVR